MLRRGRWGWRMMFVSGSPRLVASLCKLWLPESSRVFMWLSRESVVLLRAPYPKLFLEVTRQVFT